MTTHQLTRLGKVLKWTGITLALLVAVSSIGPLVNSQGSVAYERTDAGSFNAIEGISGFFDFHFGIQYLQSEVQSHKTATTVPDPGQPTDISSVSIIDISGTRTSKLLAHGMMERVRAMPTTRWVDVRVPGDPLETDRIGEVILVLEEMSCTGGGLVPWKTHHRFRAGYLPEFGWNDRRDLLSNVSIEWSLEAECRYLGLPFRGAEAVAEALADHADVPSALAEAAKKAAEYKTEASDPAPHAAIPATVETPNASLVSEVCGIESEPLLRGKRRGVRGEMLWRYEGDDVLDRIETGVAAMEALGWTRHPKSSRGSDKRLHRASVSKGTESIEWTYEENRPGLLQQESWTQTTYADGTRSEQVHHVEGPELPPVLWMHYRNEVPDGRPSPLPSSKQR